MAIRKAWLPLFGLLFILLCGSLLRIPSTPQPSGGVRAAATAAPMAQPLSPAVHLRVRVADPRAEVKILLDPAAAAWKDAVPTNILLNRTPRVYQTEPLFKGKVPSLEVRALRAENKFVLRLEWDDATKNAPMAPPRRKGEAGDPDKLYKRPTGATSQFADAAGVMIPETWTGPGFPSLQMGDAKNPMRIFYWNASRGAEELAAAGRATPKATERSFGHKAEHAANKWRLTMELPEQPDGVPIAFALWDGASDDRDGLKFFSIWYVLANQ